MTQEHHRRLLKRLRRKLLLVRLLRSLRIAFRSLWYSLAGIAIAPLLLLVSLLLLLPLILFTIRRHRRMRRGGTVGTPS
jgi:hypothetical protein